MTYEKFRHKDQKADTNGHGGNLSREAWDGAPNFHWHEPGTADTAASHIPNVSLYDSSTGGGGSGTTGESAVGQTRNLSTTDAQPGNGQPLTEQQQQLAFITQDMQEITALQNQIGMIENQLGFANQTQSAPSESYSPTPAPTDSNQPQPAPSESISPTPAPTDSNQPQPAPSESINPTPPESTQAPPTPPESAQPTPGSPIAAVPPESSQTAPSDTTPAPPEAAQSTNPTTSTATGDTVPGEITLPTPAPASEVATALAAGAGPNNNPNVISVDNNTELQNAVNNAQPGDVIELASGTYQPITINNSGAAGAPITIEAASGQTPLIDGSNSDAGVSIQGNYIDVQGLTITDSNYSSITLAAAQAADGNNNDPTMNSDGIAVGNSQDNPNHITIQNNSIYNTSGGGIETQGADDLAIVGNNIQHTAAYSPWGESGISIFQSKDSDGKPGTTGAYVLNNYVSGTQQLVNSEAIGQNVITDGNGIILDTNSSTYDKTILVAGNDVTGNDRGIEVGNTNNATVTGNTSYNNDNSTDTFGLDDVALIISSGDTVTNNVTNNGTSITNAATGFQTYNSSYSA